MIKIWIYIFKRSIIQLNDSYEECTKLNDLRDQEKIFNIYYTTSECKDSG